MENPGASTSAYPVRLEVRRPDAQSRLTNLPLFIGTFIRLVLSIPHLVALYLLGILASIVFFIASFAILFTGRYPDGMFRFSVGVNRWSTNVGAYLSHLFDDYPPFSTDQQDFPVTVTVDYPEKLSRILNAPFIGWLIKAVLLIPHYIALFFMVIVTWVLLFVAQFAILFSGSFPEGMHRFIVGYLRWQLRVNGYASAWTDKYPPFSMS